MRPPGRDVAHTGRNELRGAVGTRGPVRCYQCERSDGLVHNPPLVSRTPAAPSPPARPHQPQPRALHSAAFGRTGAGTVRLGRRKFHGHARDATGASMHDADLTEIALQGALRGQERRLSRWRSDLPEVTSQGCKMSEPASNSKAHRASPKLRDLGASETGQQEGLAH